MRTQSIFVKLSSVYILSMSVLQMIVNVLGVTERSSLSRACLEVRFLPDIQLRYLRIVIAFS
jgi:hypothetical protein